MRGFPKLNLKILQNLQIKVQSKQVKRALKLGYNTANILFQELLPAGFTNRQTTDYTDLNLGTVACGCCSCLGRAASLPAS